MRANSTAALPGLALIGRSPVQENVAQFDAALDGRARPHIHSRTPSDRPARVRAHRIFPRQGRGHAQGAGLVAHQMGLRRLLVHDHNLWRPLSV